MVDVEEKVSWTLTANDRCDAKECKAQAYVDVKGVTGNLLFCSHHYNKIMSNEIGSEKMKAFAFETIDERERLIENRTKGED